MGWLSSSKKALSSMLVAILLIGLTIAGGLLAFYALSSFISSEHQKIILDFQNVFLYSTPDKIICAGTIKNIGVKPAKQVTVTLDGEDPYILPEITEQTPLEPGETVGFSFQPTKQYIVGYRYLITLEAVATDQSTFSHVISIQCLGLGYHGKNQGTVIFEVLGIGTYGPILEVDGAQYSFDNFPLVFTWEVNSNHSFVWSQIVEWQPGGRKRYAYGYTLAEGPSKYSLGNGFGEICVKEGTTVISGVYTTQYLLETQVFGAGKIKLDVQTPYLYSFTEIVDNTTLWVPAGSAINATPIPDTNYLFDYWMLDSNQNFTVPLLFNMFADHLLQCYFKIGGTVPGSAYDLLEGPIYQQVAGKYESGIEGPIWFAPLNGSDALGNPWGGYYDWATRVTRKLTIEVVPPGAGVTFPAPAHPPGYLSYPDGERVTVRAMSNYGYRFDHWELDGQSAGTTETIEVIMDSDHTLIAYFEELPKYQLTIQVNDPAYGTTDPAPGTYLYYEGTEVEISAEPNVGFKLDYWKVDGLTETENPLTIIMDKNYTVTAYFVEANGTVTFKVQNLDDSALNPVLTVDGVDYTYDQLPISFVWPAHSTHSFSWTSWVSAGENKAFSWKSTSGLSTQRAGIIETPETEGEVIGKYIIEYTLTIQVSPADKGKTTPPVGTYWVSQGANIKVDVNPNLGYKLHYWLLDGENVGTQNSIVVTMDKPHVLCAVITQVDLSNIARRLATICAPAVNIYYISSFDYVTTFIIADHPELKGHISGIQLTFKDWDAFGWSEPKTISLGSATLQGNGAVIKIWNAYVILDTGDVIQITYEGSEFFYLYYDSGSCETKVTIVDPTGTDP